MQTDWYFNVIGDGEYAGVIDVLHDSGESLMRVGDPALSYGDIARVRAFAEHYAQLKAQHDALYLAVEGEVERLRKAQTEALSGADVESAWTFRTRQAQYGANKNTADRLQAILKAAGEKREVPDYGELVSALRYISGEDVAGMDAHLPAKEVALKALAHVASEQKGADR